MPAVKSLQDVRFPVEPLLEVCRARFRETLDSSEKAYLPPSDSARMAQVLGISKGTACRYIKNGVVPLRAADNFATELQVAPWLLWPEWLDDESWPDLPDEG